MPGGRADRDETAIARGIAHRGPQREPATQRVPDEHAALAPLGDLGKTALEECSLWSSSDGSLARAQPLGGRGPRVAALHEPGDEDDASGHDARSAAMIPINRTYAPLQAFVDELVRCGMTPRGHLPGFAERADRPDARRPGRRSRRSR